MSQPPASKSTRQIVWPSVVTVISAAILIGAEVFGAAFAGAGVLASQFLGPMLDERADRARCAVSRC